MAKRYTDSEKWKNPWFRDLPETYRWFWIYLTDSCTYTGIWRVDFALAEFSIGLKIDKSEALKYFGKHVIVVDDDKWFIPAFIKFQYKVLTHSAFHKKIRAELIENDIDPDTLSIPYKPPDETLSDSLSDRSQDKDKDKDKDKEEEKEKEGPKGVGGSDVVSLGIHPARMQQWASSEDSMNWDDFFGEMFDGHVPYNVKRHRGLIARGFNFDLERLAEWHVRYCSTTKYKKRVAEDDPGRFGDKAGALFIEAGIYSGKSAQNAAE